MSERKQPSDRLWDYLMSLTPIERFVKIVAVGGWVSLGVAVTLVGGSYVVELLRGL